MLRGKTVPARLISNSLEFEGIKIGIIDPLPDAEKQNGIFVLEPLLDQGTRSIEVANHVGKGDIVTARARKDADGRSLNFDVAAFGFTHGMKGLRHIIVL